MSIRKVIKFNNINKKIFRGGAVMKKNNILDVVLLVLSFVFIILIRYLYENNAINNWFAFILTIGIIIVLNYSLIKELVIKIKNKIKI